MRSTGPRTPQGKARVSINAITHGLNAQVAIGDALNADVDDLAFRLGQECDAGFTAATVAAEAQAFLVRIRSIKLHIVKVAFQRVWDEYGVDGRCSNVEAELVALLNCGPQLITLDGYERKARSRRKKALRALYE
ncbi:MAG: hypothetical protein ACHP84_10600 [Caulobacterales bacterium]